MNNQIQNASDGMHGEEQTSEQLTAQLAEARAKRAVISEEAAKASAALSEAQAQLDFSKPKTIDAATNATARASVIEGALTRLDEQIADSKTHLNPTIGVCWDADRLDLTRVGMTPKPKLLSTQAARDFLTP